MRAYDIAVLVILFSGIMGVLDISGMFDGGQLDFGDTTYDGTDLDNYPVDGDESLEGGWAEKISRDIWNATTFVFNLFKYIGFLSILIIEVFGDSSEAYAVALIVQGGQWAVYAVALFQGKSGKSLKVME